MKLSPLRIVDDDNPISCFSRRKKTSTIYLSTARPGCLVWLAAQRSIESVLSPIPNLTSCPSPSVQQISEGFRSLFLSHFQTEPKGDASGGEASTLLALAFVSREIREWRVSSISDAVSGLLARVTFGISDSNFIDNMSTVSQDLQALVVKVCCQRTVIFFQFLVFFGTRPVSAAVFEM